MGQTVGQYLGKTKGPVINQHDVSDDYRRNHAQTFGSWGLTLDRYLRDAKPDESFPDWKARVAKHAK